MATPCRQLLEMGEGIGLEGVPDIADTTAERPKAGVLRISQEAIDARLRRVFTPNVRGEFKLSAEIVGQWKSKKGRQPLRTLFQTVGFSPDTWINLLPISTQLFRMDFNIWSQVLDQCVDNETQKIRIFPMDFKIFSVAGT